MPGYAADLIRQRDHGFGVVGTATNFMCPTGCEAGLYSGSAHKLAAVEQIAVRFGSG